MIPSKSDMRGVFVAEEVMLAKHGHTLVECNSEKATGSAESVGVPNLGRGFPSVLALLFNLQAG